MYNNIIKNITTRTALVQARVDTAIKEKAEQYFHTFGMDTATAVRIFMAKVADTCRIPFTTGFDPEDVHDAKIADEAYKEYLSGGKQSRPFAALINELDLQHRRQ